MKNEDRVKKFIEAMEEALLFDETAKTAKTKMRSECSGSAESKTDWKNEEKRLVFTIHGICDEHQEVVGDGEERKAGERKSQGGRKKRSKPNWKNEEKRLMFMIHGICDEHQEEVVGDREERRAGERKSQGGRKKRSKPKNKSKEDQGKCKKFPPTPPGPVANIPVVGEPGEVLTQEQHREDELVSTFTKEQDTEHHEWPGTQDKMEQEELAIILLPMQYCTIHHKYDISSLK